MNKKIKYDSIQCDEYSFQSTAKNVKKYIDLIVQQAKEKSMIGEGVFVSRIYHDYDTSYVIFSYEFERSETEEEKLNREKIEADLKAKKLKQDAAKRKMKKDAEYAEFLRLKEKFEGIENA
jgi:hypothetical protein